MVFPQLLDPGRLPAPQDGPVSITAEFQVDPTRRSEFIKARTFQSAHAIFGPKIFPQRHGDNHLESVQAAPALDFHP